MLARNVGQGLVNLNGPLAIQTQMLVEMLVGPLDFDVVPVRDPVSGRPQTREGAPGPKSRPKPIDLVNLERPPGSRSKLGNLEPSLA